MSLVTLSKVLLPARAQGYAVAGLVTLGWEDMCAFVEAAEAEDCPVILQAGPGCRAHTPLPVLGKMLRHLAQQARVPVVAHLDHATTKEDCQIAIDCGFSSVMFDGSRLPLSENIDRTAEIAQMAQAAGVSCEGEIGFVGYDAGAASEGTLPEEAARFARETQVDAMAISIGNVHLQQDAMTQLDETRLRDIEALTNTPLVIHGGSGVDPAQRQKLAQTSNICKYNIGTELRQVFGQSLRQVLAESPDAFDRIEILKQTQPPMVAATRQVLRGLKPRSI